MHDSPILMTRRRHLSLLGGLGLAAMVGCLPREKSGRRLRFWHIWNPKVYPVMEEIMQRFRADNPGLQVEETVIPSPFLRVKLLTALQEGTLPDVFALNSAWMEQLGGERHLQPLAKLVQADNIDLRQRMRPHDLSRSHLRDQLLSLPCTSSSGTAMLFINEVLREQAGMPAGIRYVNWAELTKASRDLVRRLNPGNSLDYIALDPFFSPGLQIQSALAAGIGVMPVAMDGHLAQLTHEGSLRVARILDDYVEEVYGPYGGYRALLRWRTRFMVRNPVSNFIAVPFDRQVFSIAATGAISSYQRFMSPLRLSIQPLPGLERLHGGVATPTWSYAIRQGTPQLREAWYLLRYLSLEEQGVGRFCQSFRRASPLRAFDERVYREELGTLWDGAREAMSLDVSYPRSMMDECLRDLYYSIPMRRMQGTAMREIMELMNHKLQAYIDSDQQHTP
jgi:hypothetical protein